MKIRVVMFKQQFTLYKHHNQTVDIYSKTSRYFKFKESTHFFFILYFLKINSYNN